MKIKTYVEEGCFYPIRAHEADAGLDLMSPAGTIIKAGRAALIDTGVHVLIPAGYVGMVKSRSGLMVKKGLHCEGVIDAGYTGPINVKLTNSSGSDQVIEPMDRIAQLVIMPIVTPGIETVTAADLTAAGLEISGRETGGIGSTGE